MSKIGFLIVIYGPPYENKELSMKKLICLLLTLCVTVCALTACGANFSGVKDFGGEVSSNGGFAVVKGDYVYFINGKGASGDDNTFGSVVKGALVRAKLSDVKNVGTATECEVVVPKLFYTDYDFAKSGFFIFGDYVYYATPSANKDKTGTVKNNFVEFTKTKLDGTGTSVIASYEGLSTPYTFVAKGNDVYLTVYISETDDDGNSTGYLVTYSENGKEIKKSQAVSAYIFSDDKEAAYAYYKKSGYNADLDKDEDFDEIYRYSLTGEDEVKVMSGAGMYTSETGIGTQGVTYNFIKLTKDTLYFSETFVDTSVSTITRYYGVKTADLTENTAHDKPVLLNKGTSDAAGIFTEKSVYYAMDKIIYNDATYGLVVYDYNKQDDIKSFGIEQLIYSSDIMSYTYCFDDGEYMYYLGNTYYYRLSIADALNKTENVHQITYTTTSGSSDFYRFEIIGDTMLILNSFDPFYDYVCAYDITKLDKLTVDGDKTKKEVIDEFCEEFATADREHVLARLNYRVAILSDADKEALDAYMNGSYPENSASK